MDENAEKYAVLLLPGGRWDVIKRDVDAFGKPFWRSTAQAVGEFEARDIVDGLNKGRSLR